MILNKVNGKRYIGQTDNLEERWRNHAKPTSNCTYLKNAFKKYGLNNFQIKLLIICFNTDMDRYEMEYVRKYNTLVPNGYNLREGGSNGKHHETTKNKISTALKSKTWDYAKPQLGKPHTEEVKEKISKALKGRMPVGLHTMIERAKRLAKPIVQLTFDDAIVSRYESSVPAGIAMNVNKASIHRACKSKSKIYLGYKWMYEEDYNIFVTQDNKMD